MKGYEGSMKCKIIKSFYDWCMENNRKDLLDRWDYDLNKCSPKDVNYNIHHKYYFKCPRGLHESELILIYSITEMKIKTKCKKCNSFAQWCIDNIGEHYLEKYWDYNINKNINPWNISYATSKYKVCLLDNNSNKHFVKPNYFIRKGDYLNLKNGISCDSVSHRNIIKLDDKCPEVIKIWSDKNNKFPHDYSYKSRKMVWITDHNGHDYYTLCYNIYFENINIYNICFKMDNIIKNLNYKKTHIKANKCANISKLERKVRIYLNNKYKYKVNYEQDCTLIVINPHTQRRLLYDNEIEDLKLIIEVHGKQHYFINSMIRESSKEHGLTPEQELHRRKLYDRYKKYVAYFNHYSYLAIPWWTEFDDSYKRMIDIKIREIIKINKQVA